MPFTQSTGGVWVPEGTTQAPKSAKSWQDVLYSVRGNQLERWDISKKSPFKSNYTIYRAITLIASNVAQVPLLFYENDEPVKSNNELNLLFKRPNPYTSNYELWENTIMYLYDKGEAMWYLNTNDYGIVKEIYVLNPSFMEHHVSKETGQIDTWVFNKKIPMTSDEVIHFKLPSISGLRGMSPLQTVLLELSADEQAAIFSHSYFKNGAKISGVLSTEKDVEITPDELKKVVDSWNQTHQGADRAYKVAGLLGGMKYSDLGNTSLKDMDFLAGRKDIRNKLMVLLGVNPTVMGIVEDVNLANALTGMRQFAELTLLPQLMRLQQKINATLCYTYYPSYKCKFDRSSITALKDDFNKLLEAAGKLLAMGYTRNEINTRLELNMPETDDDMDLLPLNLVTRGDMSIDLSGIQPTKSIEDNIIDKVEQKLPDIQTKKDLAYRRTYLRLQRQMEIPFNKKVKTIFYKQRGKVLNILANSTDIHEIQNKLSTLFNDENKVVKDALRPLYVETATAGEQLANNTLGKSMGKELISQNVIDNRLNLITGINDTTFNQIKLELFEGTNAGETIADIADRIRGVYNFGEKRSIIIARTETASTISETSYNVYKHFGVKMKNWISTKDDKTRETHIQNDNDGNIPIGQAFSGTGEQYPGQVNCRCCVSPIIDI